MADEPIREATPVIMDGPEGWSEQAASDQSEEDEPGQAYADSADSPSESAPSESSREGEASNYKRQDTGTGGSESSPEFLSDSPRKMLAINPAPFGSPFVYASYQNKPDFFKGLLVENTRALFDQIVADAPSLRHNLTTPSAFTKDGNLTDDGSCPNMCQFENVEYSGLRVDSSKQSNDRKLQIFDFPIRETETRIFVYIDPKFEAHSQTDVARSDPVDPKKGFDVYRHRNLETGRFEYFVENEDSVYLSINGIRVDSSVRAGPLPSFAVFEFQDYSMFWWCTVAALEYMPVRWSQNPCSKSN